MRIHVSVDVPAVGESMSFGRLSAFVHAVEAVGVDLDTPVALVSGSSGGAVALRVDLESPSGVPHQGVRLTARETAWLLSLLDGIESDDGDARSRLGDVRDLRHMLMDRALGIGGDDDS